MKIKVNGEVRNLNVNSNNIPLPKALNYLGYKNNKIVVELNNLIVNSAGWKETNIKNGDKLEIVSIVGGG
tara:strand:- start:21 stop:230 length:210 start_codon:yes stop_codon:yes gene_type:complete